MMQWHRAGNATSGREERRRRRFFLPVSASLLLFCLKRTELGLPASHEHTPVENTGRNAVAGSAPVFPDWHLTTECSVFSRDCVPKKLTQNRYAKYPFKVGAPFDGEHKWENYLPEGWESAAVSPGKYLAKHATNKTEDSTPEQREVVDVCMRDAQQTSVDEQLHGLLRRLGRAHEMVAFSVTDWAYANDMIHDVYQMADKVVGFGGAYFVVAMDTPTMRLCCKYNYPFLAWPQAEKGEGALRKAVANSKFEVSHKLLQQNTSFFFFEMDVWFLQSPKELIARQDADIVFSSHQDNPAAANIGVYSVLATDGSRDFFRGSIDLVTQRPDVHDQVAMQTMEQFMDNLKHSPDKELKFSGFWSLPHPRAPKINFLASIKHYSTHEFVADEHPVVSGDTIAIHPLCGTPLMPPHGKKMVAKELSAWYGAKEYYYGRHNRFLWVDGHVWNGLAHSMSWPDMHPHRWYHNYHYLRVSIATTIALARRTGRIWVIPKFLSDYGTHILWVMLDMQSVEDLVEVRETNFPTNPKSWHNASVPFGPVARTALSEGGRIYAQLRADASADVLAWKARDLINPHHKALDAWFAIHHVVPELDEAQVLLAGLPAANDFADSILFSVQEKRNLLSIAEREVVEVYEKLRWCKKEMRPQDLAGGTVIRAGQDCWGRGVEWGALKD